jgi:hypothetical protein
MLPEWPEPQLPTPSPNANEGGRQKLIVNAEGVASKTGDTRGKFTGSPGQTKTYCQRRGGCPEDGGHTAASFRGRRANERARKMLTHSLSIYVCFCLQLKSCILFFMLMT